MQQNSSHACMELSLQHDFQSVASNERINFFESVSKIDEIWSNLPFDYRKELLRKHERNQDTLSLQHIIYRSYMAGFRKLVFFLNSTAQNSLKKGWQKLIDHCKDLNERKKVIMATKLQSSFRRFTCNRQYKIHQLDQKQKNVISTDDISQDQTLTHSLYWIEPGIKGIEQCTLIQARYRGFIVRKQCYRLRLLHTSADIIQSSWRNCLLRKRTIAQQVMILLKRKKCVQIQTWFRKIRAQILVKYMIYLRSKSNLSSQRFNMTKIITHRFTRLGAAHIISQWYKKYQKDKTIIEKKKETKSHKSFDYLKLNSNIGERQYSCHYSIQTSVPLNIKKIFERYSTTFQERKNERNVYDKSSTGTEKAAITMQTAWRVAYAREILWKKILHHFQKIVNDKEIYWYNKKSGTCIKRKPFFFYHRDITTPISIPRKDISLEKRCDFCGKTIAKFYDVKCCEAFCDDCKVKIHCRGRRRNNEVFQIIICSHCEFQMASKHCTICNDAFCDNCFLSMHKSSMLKLHPFRTLLKHCRGCKIIIARLKNCIIDDYFCNRCAQRQMKNENTNFKNLFEQVDPIPSNEMGFS